ncbi:hybrid sensor histidine kinase/response regulator transcription factor [Dyadobacter luticola]|uniref:histidine kinase n=1 Tax=Dyadobacter luticola TaxID=1979387 RepID=A0A5R9L445_9BACT|nr:ATP-binding protein [Dyadobacter luticola]TLV03323.1 response regulator [Dyadobacter luticola]
MLRNRILCSIGLLAFAVINAAWGQSVKKPIRVIGTRDGLPQSFVSGLVQDANGFVWIGTLNGVARYDGINFKIFRNAIGDTCTISSNVILSMTSDTRRNIWIEHASGQIDLLDPVSEQVSRVTSHALFRKNPIRLIRRGWLGDVKNHLWVFKRGDGVYRFDFDKNKVAHFAKSGGHFASDTLRGILEDRQKRIWILDQHAISYLDTATQKFKTIRIPYELDFGHHTDSDGEVVSLFERKSGEIMFSDRDRLFFYQPKSGTFRYKTLLKKAPAGIRTIQRGPDEKEYFETEGNVYRYDDRAGIVRLAEIENPKHWETPSFLVDDSGLIWLGTNAAGIHQIDLATPLFESQPTLNSFHQDVLRQELHIDLAWMANWPIENQNFAGSSYVTRSTYDRQGRLWLGLRNKVGYYDPASKKLVLLPEVPGVSDPGDLVLGIRGMSFAPDGTLWVVGDNGKTLYFDFPGNKWLPFMDSQELRKVAGPAAVVVDCHVDDHQIFLTTSNGGGLLIVDKVTKKIRRLRQAGRNVLMEDLLLGSAGDPTRKDLLWIGSYSGLILVNKKTLQTRVFSMRDGLPDNTIYGMLTDKSGYFWLSTNKGLCRFHPVTHKIQTFLSDDGLPDDEFNRFHALKLPDGRLAFGGTAGWTIFDPNAMQADTYRPQVAFTNLKINNIDASQYDNLMMLPGELNTSKTLSLPYDQNSLSFEFAGLEFNRPKRLKYRYQLVGYDNDWILADDSPVASYTRLPAGEYQLRINASNTTGQWSSHIRELTLRIRPPFWLTWWAHCFYAIVVAVMIWAYARYLANRERLRQEIIIKNREAEQLKTLDSLKTRFFSNITHEFRTPLTLILTPVQRLKPTLNGTEQQRWLSAIERNANQLLRLINQLLDLSKLESGNLKVNEALGNPGRFLEELVSSFIHEAEAKNIFLVFKQSGDAGNYWFDPDKLEQIVSNLVANAIKFTPKGGEVQIALNAQNGQVEIEVCDSGVGISEEKIPHIFNRFFRVETPAVPGQYTTGSGIGLSIVKELVELQGGAILVESPPAGQGFWRTRFLVTLPYRRSEDNMAWEVRPEPGNIAPAFYSKIDTTNPEQSAESPTVLLVEDNAELADFIADSLSENYTILRASNGVEGLDLAIETMPDLVLSDVLMPEMDGFEFCNKLKNDERTNHIPVILLTALSSFDDKIEGLTIGADDYLTKPFHIQELQLRVGNLLERQQQLRNKLRSEVNSPAEEKLVQEPTLHDMFIRKLYSIIEERLDDSLFGVEDLAAEIGMSRASLHRKVKSLTGTSPGDLMRNYRLKRAAQFLRQGYNSSETAFKTGFDSASYFSKCFKDFYQVTPNEFA